MNTPLSDQPESIAAILAEMRRANFQPQFYQRCVNEYADRIEAAAEREYEEAKAYFEKLHDGPSMICTAKNCAMRNVGLAIANAAPGNAAALRAALVAFVDSIQWLCDGDERGIFEKQFAPLLSEARAALSAPARNCDRFQTADEASAAFRRERPDEASSDFAANLIYWLFAAAAGGAE